MKTGGSFKTAAIVAAATVGDGIFALPYVFRESGWLVCLFYLALLAVLVSAAHIVYLKTLEKIGEKERLLGLAKRYLGQPGFWMGFIAIVVGLLLSLVAILILGAQFVHLALPAVSPTMGLLIFWLLISLPVFIGDRKVVDLELVGITCASCIIILIFTGAWPNVAFAGVPAVNLQNLFLPFGVILFSLAGWTGVEPAYESRKRSGRTSDPWKALASGTFFVAMLYMMFASGVIGSAPAISPDTVAGLAAWPAWKKEIIAIFGLIAVATIYLPMSREIKNSLEKDLHWNKFAARGVIILAPLVLIWLGFNDFLVVVGFVGGLFLSLQYLLIISVGRRALVLSAAKRFLLDLIAAVFVIAAVYELWTFVVH